MLIVIFLLSYIVESASSQASFLHASGSSSSFCLSSFHPRRGIVDCSSSVMHSQCSNSINCYPWHDKYQQQHRSSLRRSTQQCTVVLNLSLINDDVTTNTIDDAEKKLDSTTNINNKRATFFGLEPRELPSLSDDDNAPMLLSVDNGLQFTGPIVMILSIYFMLALFFGDVDDNVGEENSSSSRSNNIVIVGGDTSVTTSSTSTMMMTDPNVSNGYVRTWAESASINGYF